MLKMKSKRTPSYSVATVSSLLVSAGELSRAYEELSHKHHGRKEDYFGAVYISKRFNISVEHAAAYVTFDGGKNSHGIDGFYHDVVNKDLYIFAFRWTEDHMAFKDALDVLGREGVYRIFNSTSRILSEETELIASLRSCLANNWDTIDRIYLNFIFNGDPVNAEQSKVLMFLRENVEDKKSLIDSYFNSHHHDYNNASSSSNSGYSSNSEDHEKQPGQCELIFQYVSNEIPLGHATSTRKTAEYDLGLTDSLMLPGSGNELSIIFLPLSTLYRMYDEMGERFFEKNIRSGLDDGNMTNYEIKRSLRKIVNGEEPPENFTHYHNGIAMTAQMVESKGGGEHSKRIKMVEPRVINGVQTIKILKQFVETSANTKTRVRREDETTRTGNINKNKSRNDPETQMLLRQKLGNVKVIARIINSQDQDFLSRVAINNNRQNPIMPWNLRANDLVQLQFEELFSKMGIYYERRENAYKNVADGGDLEAIGTENGVIEIRKFAQTLLAMQCQIDRISEIKELFENESWYRDTFKENYLKVDPRKLVVLYKVQYRLQSVIREIKSLGIEKYNYAPKAKNLLWCLSIQGIMNDSKFDKYYVERYGNSVTIEAGITEILKRLASTKLRLILSDTLGNRKYRNYLESGKFSFLKTKAIVSDCMRTAAKHFGWQPVSLS
jgi:hypothetical protein